MRTVGIRKLSWLLVALFVALSFLQASWTARAGPPHFVTGGVPGPGVNPADPSPANPANEANATFYLVDKPAEPIVRDAQLDPADGTVPASFIADVGTAWNWDPANPIDDQVVVVIEAVRGLNGWAGVNYTSVASGTLNTSGVQDLGDAPLERIPSLTFRTGADYVNSTWTGLSSTNPNVVSYTVYRAPGPMGPWTVVGRSGPQVAAGPVYFNNTGLAEGNYCYAIAVNYRRDLAGGVYVTAGRSETTCTRAGAPPIVTQTSPAEGATAALTDAISITFSETMAIGTVTYTISPGITLDAPSWTLSNTVLTLTHATQAFGQCVSYTFTITAGTDLAGNNLVPLPFDLHFTSVGCTVPAVVVTAPAVGAILSGRSSTTVTFTLSDDTPIAQLRVWVNYTSSAGNGPIAADQTGLSSPTNVPWTTPCINATDVRVRVDAVDPAGNRGTGQSVPFAIDCAPPSVLTTVPGDQETGVVLNQAIRITFSEAMDRASTQAAIGISPTVTLTPTDFGWGAGDTVLTIAHSSARFQPRTQYTVTVGATARDVSTPGNAMGQVKTWRFTTGDLIPWRPANLRASSIGSDRATLAWDPPTNYTTGDPIPTGTAITYRLFRATSSGAAGTQVGGTLTAATYTDTGLAASTTYYYTVVAVVSSVESARSTERSVTTIAPSGPDVFLWVVLGVIIAAVVVGLLLFLMRRRKRAEAAPVPPEAPPPEGAPPEGEMPAEEPMPSEEGGPPEEGGGMP